MQKTLHKLQNHVSKKELFILTLFICITLFFSVLPTLVAFQKTPPGKIFTGYHFSGDYYVYLSFVETGVRGHIREAFLNHSDYKPLFVHGVYTISGYLGNLLGFDAIKIYLFDRLILGGLLITTIYFFYKSLWKNQARAMLALFYIFWVAGIPASFDPISLQSSRYLFWIQQLNILNRATGLPHYLLGLIFFILTVRVFLQSNISYLKKCFFMLIFSTMSIIANPINIIIYYAIFLTYIYVNTMMQVLTYFISRLRIRQRIVVNDLINIIAKSDSIGDLLVILTVGVFHIPLIIYYYKNLSSGIWGIMSNVFQYYIGNANNTDIKHLVLALGPVIFLAIVGTLSYLIKVIKNRSVNNRYHLFFITWLTGQLFLYIYAQYFHLESYRFLQGHYYIPLVGLGIYGIEFISQILLKINKISFVKPPLFVWQSLIVFISFIITLPTLLASYHDLVDIYSDPSSFITLKQYEGYKYLEENTPFASGILAGREISLNLFALTGNSVVGDSIGNCIMKDICVSDILSNKLSSDEFHKFLKDNNLSYLWYGVDEIKLGFEPQKYPFLKKIFTNDEITVFKVV